MTPYRFDQNGSVYTMTRNGYISIGNLNGRTRRQFVRYYENRYMDCAVFRTATKTTVARYMRRRNDATTPTVGRRCKQRKPYIADRRQYLSDGRRDRTDGGWAVMLWDTDQQIWIEPLYSYETREGARSALAEVVSAEPIA